MSQLEQKMDQLDQRLRQHNKEIWRVMSELRVDFDQKFVQLSQNFDQFQEEIWAQVRALQKAITAMTN